MAQEVLDSAKELKSLRSGKRVMGKTAQEGIVGCKLPLPQYEYQGHPCLR